MKKMLVSDYDGTFYLNEQNIKENIKEVRKFRDRGNIFLIATGNNYQNFIKEIRKYNIEYDYLILDDGAVIIDNNENVIYTCFIEPNIVKKIYKIIKDEIGNVNEFSKLKKEIEYGEENITKISTRIDDLKKAKLFEEKINSLFKNYIHAYTMIFDDINIVEVISNRTDKMNAIQIIQNIKNIEKSKVYVVGDGYNDIMMIKYFNGYCMANSVDDLLKVCENKVESVSDLIKKIK